MTPVRPRIILHGLALGFMALVWATGAAQPPLVERRAGTHPPNIVFVIADQWRFEAFGYAGNPDVQDAQPRPAPARGRPLRQRRLRHAGLLAHARVHPDRATAAHPRRLSE